VIGVILKPGILGVSVSIRIPAIIEVQPVSVRSDMAVM
jgi:hypothetical protein